MRKSNFELLRIICIMMIIAFHFVYCAEYDLNAPFSGNKFIVDLVYHFGEIGVNCFILISGYFLSKTKLSFKKVIALIVQCEIYLILGRIIAILTGMADAGTWGLKDYLFPIIMPQYWFLSCYVMIYLLTPFLKAMTENISEKAFRYLILVNLAVWSLFQTYIPTYFYGCEATETMDLYNRFIWLLVVFLTGAYISKYGIPFLTTMKSRVILLTATVCFIILHIFLAEFKVPFIKGATFYWEPNATPLFLLSVALFLVFEKIDIPANKVINYLASCCLGIYLIHERAMDPVWWDQIFKTYEKWDSPILILWIGLAVVTIFASGIIVESIRKALFKAVKLT